MSDSLTVRSRLELTSNVPEVVNQMIRAFTKANTVINRTQEALSGLGGRRGALTSTVASVERLSKMRMNSALLSDVKDLSDRSTSMAASMKLMADESERAAAAWRSMNNSSKGSGGGSARRGRSSGSIDNGALIDGAIGASMVGDTGLNIASQGFMANAALQQQVILLQADKRVTNAVIGRLATSVGQLQKQYPALQQLEAYKLFGENMGVFGDPSEALATLPASVRLQQLYQLMNASKGGTGGDENLAATKAGDALQAFIDPKTKQIDPALFQKWVDFQTKSVLAGGGIVDAKSWLTYARTARSSGIGYSQDALEYTQALLEMSPGRTGTALNSAFQLFGASTASLSKNNRAAWQSMGLIDRKGNLTDAAGFQDDPYTWVWNTLVPDLAKRGIKTRQQILAWLSAHGQRSTVAGALSDIAIGQTNIEKTKARFDAQDPNAGAALANSDIGKLQALYAAENNFLVALGKFEQGPGVKILEGLTAGLNDLTAWATAHPQMAKTLALTGAGMAILSKATADLALTIYLGAPLVRGMTALATASGAFAAGGKAAAGLAVVTGLLSKLSTLASVLSLSGDTPAQSHKEGDMAPSGLARWHNGHWQNIPFKEGQVTPDGKWIEHKGWLFDSLSPNPNYKPNSGVGVGASGKAGLDGTKAGDDLATLANWVKQGAPTTVTNPRDIAAGAARHLKQQLSLPSYGASGNNLRATPSGSAALTARASGQ